MMKTVCVIDLDQTLGFSDDSEIFFVRNYAHLLLDVLALTDSHLVLWSYGSDSYVESIINQHFHIFRKPEFETLVFGRTVCDISKQTYGYPKCSSIIRNQFDQNIHLIGIDDCAVQNMDPNGYDLRISVAPYSKINRDDHELFKVLLKIIEYLKNIKAC